MSDYKLPSFNNDFFNRLGQAESSGRATVVNPKSGASGIYQFTSQTWKDAVKQAGKNYTLQDRFDPEKSKEIASFLFNKEGTSLAKRLGRDLTEADMYAYHHFGLGNSRKFLEALNTEDAITADATSLFSKKVIDQNRDIFFKNGKPRSVAEVYQVLQDKINPNKQELDKMMQRGYEMMPDPQTFAQSDDPFMRMTEQSVPSEYAQQIAEVSQEDPFMNPLLYRNDFYT